MTALKPRQTVPDLRVPTLDGDVWDLSAQQPQHFTMVVVYRGLHCPICKGYLKDLDNKISAFKEKGVEVFVLSSDDEERARQAKTDWHLENTTVGYGLSIDVARAFGLYISKGIGKTSIGIEEPALFAEPGLFMIKPDRTLYFASIQTMPFARPKFDEVLQATGFVLDRGYPARGEA